MPSSGLILLILLSASAKLYSQIPDKLKHSTWEQEGYDRVLDIKDSTYAYYNKNEFSCSSLVQGNFNGRFRIIDADSSHLVLNPGGIVNYHFRKIPGLPDTCLKETVQNEKSLVLNFQSFWHTFNRNYAFFEKRDLDWKKLYRDYLPIVEGLETEAEFALILKEIADKFDDGHIRLDIPAPVPKTPKTPKKSHNRLSKDQVLSGIYTNYLDSLGSYNNGVIRWGSLKNTDIGYIAITDMNDLANYVPDRFQHSKKFDSIYNRGQDPVQPLEYFQDEIAGVQHIMPRILRDLGHSDSIIVDLRFNGGGYETVALELLSYFVSEEKEILSIKAKTEKGFTPAQKYFLKPKSSEDKKIYLLISPFTASAAEIFALGTLQYSNFERIGSRSAGIFSEILWKKLPNGWEYSLSNEVYRDPDGQSYEGKGIPIDRDLNYPEERSAFFRGFYEEERFTDQALEIIITRHSRH